MSKIQNLSYMLLLIVLPFFLGNYVNADRLSEFYSSYNGSALPWTHEQFDDSANKFSFAIVSDLNGGERKGVFDVAVSQLTLLRPDFVITVGDLIDGEPELLDISEIHRSWQGFESRIASLQAPLFFVPGNNDLTNPVMKKAWGERFGPSYYHFIYKNVLFLVLNSEDFSDDELNKLNKKIAVAPLKKMSITEVRSGQISEEQKNYFVDVINQNKNVRHTFLFMHKPLWELEDRKGIADLYEALEGRPYTMINGHMHRYSYRKRNNGDHLTLATTGGGGPAETEGYFDHITLVTMVGDEVPAIANIKLEGILDKTGNIPGHIAPVCLSHGANCQAMN